MRCARNLVLVACALGALGAGRARADRLTLKQVAAIESAFFDARYDDVIARTPTVDPGSDALDRYPLDVLERGWRVRSYGTPAPLATDPEAAARWPTVWSLVAERRYRETLGSSRLAQDSPLLARAPAWVAWQAGLYRLERPEDDPDPTTAALAQAKREEAEALRERALRLAAEAVFALLVLSVLGALACRPGGRPHPRKTT